MIPKDITIPTYLTLIRLCAAPIILPIFFVLFLPFNLPILNGFVAVLFVLFSLTDFFDGFLARHYHQESMLGRLLDPIADKFLLFSSFIGLLAADKIFFFWVIVFIGRDLFMMGLRRVAAQHVLSIPVSHWGKVRTALVMAYITCVIAHPYQKLAFTEALWWNCTEFLLLIIALALTIWSAKCYTQQFLSAYSVKMGQPVQFLHDEL